MTTIICLNGGLRRSSMACRNGVRLLVAFIWIVAGQEAQAASADLAPVPVVGCPSDGQMGPEDAPKIVQPGPRLPTSEGLAFYITSELAVLAPRGWHCAGTGGSSGANLYVTPDRHSPKDFLGNLKLMGPAVLVSRVSGGTSGRFTVAKRIARVFPSQKSFADKVISEGIMPRQEVVIGPYPTDTITRRGNTVVEFVTPPNSNGMGTDSMLQKNGMPITGVTILLPEDSIDLLEAEIRLQDANQDVVRAIIDNIEHNLAAPPASAQ